MFWQFFSSLAVLPWGVKGADAREAAPLLCDKGEMGLRRGAGTVSRSDRPHLTLRPRPLGAGRQQNISGCSF